MTIKRKRGDGETSSELFKCGHENLNPLQVQDRGYWNGLGQIKRTGTKWQDPFRSEPASSLEPSMGKYQNQILIFLTAATETLFFLNPWLTTVREHQNMALQDKFGLYSPTASDLGPSASQMHSRCSGHMSQISQTHSTGQSDVAKSYELQIRKNKAQLIQLDEMLRLERNPVIAGSLRTQKECLLEEIANLEENIKIIHRVSANVKPYKAQIAMPEYRQTPAGYRRNGDFDSKNLLRVVYPPFNPDLHPKQRLKYEWDKLLYYG